jgi:hypothetical protein
MIKLLPECSICGMPVADSVESEIKQHGKIKTGQYIKGTWICDDCKERQQKEKMTENKSSSYFLQKKKTKNNRDNKCDDLGLASRSDVSPNTPRADEADL